MEDVRRVISLDGDWDFAYTRGEPDPTAGELPKEEAYEVRIPVPAYWDDCKRILKYTKFWSRGCNFNPEYRGIEFPMGGLKPPDASLPYLVGTGWYKKRFAAEADWKNKTVALHVGGVTMEAWVWLNGEYLGYHKGHLTPFEVNLSKAVFHGRTNELIIAVSNVRADRTGCSIRGYKGRSAGITRSVSLQISGSNRIRDCYVRPDEGLRELAWQVELEKEPDLGEELFLDWRIADAAGTRILAEGSQKAAGAETAWRTETFGMESWTDNCPRLYQLSLKLRGRLGAVDRTTQSFGLRHVKRKGREIYLNGRAVLLRGATEHAYFPETCTVPTEEAYYRKAIRALKDMGYNWIRFHTWTPPEECLNAADALGMLLQVEAPNGFQEQEFVDILTACRRHPSVILYCCGNEVPITDKMNAKLERMADICHRLAPDCLFNPMGALIHIECRLDREEPGYTETPVPHNALKLEKLRAYSDAFSTGVWVFSYRSLCDDDKKIRQMFEIYDRPCLIHEAGINDTYLNLDLERRYDNTRIGTDLFRAARAYMTEMGLVQNAAVYYRNSCRWMYQVMKFSMEKARRCDYISGYDFLGAIDCHWHRTGYGVGIMNEFYEPKAGFSREKVRQFNGESVLLADCGRERNLWAGDTLRLRFSVSLYGEEDMEQGLLAWRLEDDCGRIWLRGQKGTGRLKRGGISGLGEVSLVAPEVKEGGRHFTLKASLSGGEYEIENGWDYWVFPRQEMPHTSGLVRERKRLDEEDIRYMEEGGRILLLGRGPFPGLPVSFQIMSGGRVNGNCATVIYDHPLMRDFPQEGFCDWQLYPMFQNGGTIVFNDLDIPFEPVVEIVSSYKMIRKQASVFELGVGKGGMLVCALNVNGADPGAVNLKQLMLRYLESAAFAPRNKVTTGWLLNRMKNDSDLRVDFATDECWDKGGQVD